MKMKTGILKMFFAMICLGCGTCLLQAADFVNVTTNIDDYVVQEQTDNWIGSMLTVNYGMVVESNAVVGFVSSTNTCYKPVSTSYRQNNYIGRNGDGSLWALDSLINVTYAFTIGDDADGSMYLTNSTFIAERDPGTGTFALRVGKYGSDYAGANTGVLEMVNSHYRFNSTSPYCYIYIGSSCHGQLILHNSSIGDASHIYGMLTSGGGTLAPDQAIGSFNASTVTVYRCRVGGDPALAYSNGKYTFTSNSVLRMPSGWNDAWHGGPPGLMVGYWGSTDYTSTVTVAESSRVESAYKTFVGYKSSRGNGRLTFTSGSVGILNDDVSLGVENNSSGRLDVFDDSEVYVTNTLGTASLIVGIQGYGELNIDGGSCYVDELYLTNGVNSVLSFDSGLLRVGSGVISNEATMVIGDGVESATFEQFGGGITTVHGDMSFQENSHWRIDADASTDEVLDVAGELSFDSTVDLFVATTNDYDVFDGRVIAVADDASTVPDVVDGQQLRVFVEDASGGRKALVLKSYKPGSVIIIR